MAGLEPRTLLRIVLGTSCFVSYLLTSGTIMQQVIDLWRRGDVVTIRLHVDAPHPTAALK